MIVLVKDLRGIRLSQSVEDTDSTHTLEDGMVVGRDVCWPATSQNLELAATDLATFGLQRIKYVHLEDSFDQTELEGAQMVVLLRKFGYDIDDELRLRRRMTPPFTDIQEGHIMPIIQSHLDRYEKMKKDPTSMPINIGSIEGHIVFQIDDKQLASGQHEGGSIMLFENKQVILKYMDWHFIPKSSMRGILQQYLKCEPTGASSVKELCGKESFLADDGVLCQWGLRKLLWMMGKKDFKERLEIGSVDDIIGDIKI